MSWACNTGSSRRSSSKVDGVGNRGYSNSSSRACRSKRRGVGGVGSLGPASWHAPVAHSHGVGSLAYSSCYTS